MRQSAQPAAPLDGADVFAISQTPMAIMDGANRIRAVNRAWADLAGEPEARLVGRTLAAALPLEAATMQPFPAGEGEARRWLRLDLQPTGEVTLASLTDVTAEQAQIQALRDDHEIRDRLLGDAMVGVWRFDPETQLYHFASALDLGWGPPGEATDLETLIAVQHRDDRAIDAAVREELTRNGGSAEREIRYRHREGHWVHLHVRYRSGRRLPSGLYEMYGLSQNITPQARARDEAKAAGERLTLALKGAGAAVFEYDYASEGFWASPELANLADAERLNGAAVDPLLLFHEEDHEAIKRFRRSASLGESPAPIDVRLAARSGFVWTRFHLEVELRPDGRPRRAVGLLLDVDEQKRQAIALAEARRTAEEATAAKSAFLASVSHEIRTPMNGIVGVLNLLRREPLSEEARQLLGEALGCSDMLGQLINDVLDFSKIEAGKLDIDPVPADPVAVAQSVVNLIRPQAEAKGLYLRTQIAADIGWLSLDPLRLRQCLFNTLGNAVKFTERGGVELRMRLAEGAGGRKLRCEIEDTGVGISQAAQARLFDRFAQGEAGATTRRFGGTGLGLAIARTLARLMGGDMGFTSVEGEGSTFWCEVAAVPAERPDEAGTAAEDGAPLAGLNVLVVDDNRVNRLVGAKTLEALGARAEAVESGPAAIEAVARTAFDLVLMDVNMPGMDGLEATRRLREAGAALPILAMTADVMAHHRERYAAAGMDGLVPKPFSPAQLIGEIVRLTAEPPPQAEKASA